MNDNRTLIVPILLIAVGTGWLLTTLGIAPDINWVWTLAIAMVGAATFLVCGFDKFSFVVGTSFLVMSLLSVLRQSGSLTLDTEVPSLVIVFGVLMLVARSKAIPFPTWIDREPPPSS